jgi:1-acyl-sn-glycerol-3-phosphate acyltransferase
MERELELQSPFFLKVGLPLARALAWILFTLFGPFRVKRRDRFPKEGGILILSNHLSDVDPIAVHLACPRPVYFMAKSELFDMFLIGRVIRWFKAFPVKRGEPDRTSIKKAVALLKAGHVVCVYPEGELSESTDLLPFKPGIALIVRMAGVPVIPLGLKRTNSILPYGSLLPRPALGWVEALWGAPKSFGKDATAEEIVAWAEEEVIGLTGQKRAAIEELAKENEDAPAK